MQKIALRVAATLLLLRSDEDRERIWFRDHFCQGVDSFVSDRCRMYTGFERLWNALALFGFGAEAFGGDGNFDGNKFFCYYWFLTRRSSSFVFRVSDCHQNSPL